MSQIFAFGDSVTWGSWDVEGGWADRIKKDIINYIDSSNKGKEIVFYNLGIPSNRTDYLLDRFCNEVDQRFDEDNQEKYFIFEFGANDAAYKLDEQKFRVDIKDFEQNYIKAINLAKKYSNNILIINITPVDESKTDGVLNKNKSRKNIYVDKYNEVISKVADENKIELIDINIEFKKVGANTLLSKDGLHPNSNGYELIFEQVKKYLVSKNQLA